MFKVNDRVTPLPSLFDPKLPGHDLIVQLITPGTTYTVKRVAVVGNLTLAEVDVYQFDQNYWRLAGAFSLGEIA